MVMILTLKDDSLRVFNARTKSECSLPLALDKTMFEEGVLKIIVTFIFYVNSLHIVGDTQRFLHTQFCENPVTKDAR